MPIRIHHQLWLQFAFRSISRGVGGELTVSHWLKTMPQLPPHVLLRPWKFISDLTTNASCPLLAQTSMNTSAGLTATPFIIEPRKIHSKSGLPQHSSTQFSSSLGQAIQNSSKNFQMTLCAHCFEIVFTHKSRTTRARLMPFGEQLHTIAIHLRDKYQPTAPNRSRVKAECSRRS